MMADLFPEVDLSQEYENEDDSFDFEINLLDGVLVTDTDWTAETILSQLKKGNILLNPKFQRRDAWNVERKSRFIESLLLGIPIPQLVLAELPDQRGKYVVIDGKQRLLALQKFSDTQGGLKLSGLTIRTDLNGKTWSNIQAGQGKFDDCSAFENAAIRTTLIKGYKSEKALYVIFHRLNSGSVPLSPQELRHVLHPGPFIDFAFEFSENSETLVSLLGRDGKPDFRMRDVEMLIRFFGFSHFLPSYQGDLKEFLDLTVKNLNNSWSSDEFNIRALAVECENSIKATIDIFGENAFSKSTNKGFEKRFNRAVFDIMTFYFKHDSIRIAAINNKEAVQNRFIELCNEPQFRKSLESTTKSFEATMIRLEWWGSALQGIVDVSVPNPLLSQL